MSVQKRICIPLLYLVAAVSILLNVFLVQRLQSIAEDDRSYVLDPESGMVWQLDTHAEFVKSLTSNLLPYWVQAPVRVETSDSLVLIGHLAPITQKCDWRGIERYRKLQRTCFHYYDTVDAEEATIISSKVIGISERFADHPVVGLVSERLANAGKENEFPTLLLSITMTVVGPVSSSGHEQLEPKSAILFRGWAARNFEVATAMVLPNQND